MGSSLGAIRDIRQKYNLTFTVFDETIRRYIMHEPIGGNNTNCFCFC